MIERLLPAGPHHRVRLRCSDRADGDFHVDLAEAELAARRATFAPAVWTWLRQVHGNRVVVVNSPGEGAGTSADAAVTTQLGVTLAVQTADCVPIVLSAVGGVAVAHAGWRGVVSGVIPAAVAELRSRTSGDVHAFVGPHIRAPHYEFGADELAEVAAVSGEGVRGRTLDHRPALDMTAAVGAALADAGVSAIDLSDDDTAASGWFSHRVRGDKQRQVTAAWLEPLP